jgi:hypothetical protein
MPFQALSMDSAIVQLPDLFYNTALSHSRPLLFYVEQEYDHLLTRTN